MNIFLNHHTLLSYHHTIILATRFTQLFPNSEIFMWQGLGRYLKFTRYEISLVEKSFCPKECNIFVGTVLGAIVKKIDDNVVAAIVEVGSSGLYRAKVDFSIEIKDKYECNIYQRTTLRDSCSISTALMNLPYWIKTENL